MTSFETIAVDVAENGIATVTLNRPEVRNAMNPQMIGDIRSAVDGLSSDATVRAIVFQGAGSVFCSGGDLNWMRDVAGKSRDEVETDSLQLVEMYKAIDRSPKATVGAVRGAAMAGGLGIVACCDVVIAERDTKFAVTEVKIGLAPGVIAAFLLPRIGAGALRRYAVAGSLFDTNAARRIGLIHHIGMDDAEFDSILERVTGDVLASSPDAIAMTKDLIRDLNGPADDASIATGLGYNVDARMSDQAAEGIGAFLEKSTPGWAR